MLRFPYFSFCNVFSPFQSRFLALLRADVKTSKTKTKQNKTKQNELQWGLHLHTCRNDEESERKLLDFGIRWHASLESKLGSTPAPVTYKTMNIKIGGSKNEHHIHTIKYISSEEKEKGTPILFIHGYGSGAGIWHLTLPIFATLWNGPVYAIDSFDCGLSSRPAWNGPMGSELDVDECEDLFSETIEGWRKAMMIDKFTIVGHPSGALSSAYAERHHSRIERLALVSRSVSYMRPRIMKRRGGHHLQHRYGHVESRLDTAQPQHYWKISDESVCGTDTWTSHGLKRISWLTIFTTA